MDRRWILRQVMALKPGVQATGWVLSISVLNSCGGIVGQNGMEKTLWKGSGMQEPCLCHRWKHGGSQEWLLFSRSNNILGVFTLEFLYQVLCSWIFWCGSAVWKVFVVLSFFLLPWQPSHGDKTSNPEVLKWMNDLAKGRKQLKGKCQLKVCFLGKEAVVVVMCPTVSVIHTHLCFEPWTLLST